MLNQKNNLKDLIAQQSVATILCIGIFFGAVLFFLAQAIFDGRSNCVSSLEFIRDNLDCDVADAKAEKLNSLEGEVSSMIDGYKKEGLLNRAGVFVRDLKTTRFFSVNESEEFVMASLLKVPLAIAGYKLAEVEPSVLDQHIVYTGENNLYDQQYFQVQEQLEVGKEYTLRELIRRSIVFSDNTAAQMISDYYAAGFFPRILEALGLHSLKRQMDDENIVTPRTYANLYRSLYNASYLKREYANEILGILTQTQFNSGALSKLPTSVKVAHKFAERTFYAPEDRNKKTPIMRQLHECGIVYAKDGTEPYSFCIMTEGIRFEDLEKVQGEISYKIYSSI